MGMRTVGVFCVLGFAVMSFTISEVTRFIYKQDGIRVEYGKERGMITSRYTSYWPNGKKKAEGEMRANMRFGDWNIWDSTGQLVMARNYETGYSWTQLYPIEFNSLSSKGWFGDRYSVFLEIKPDSVIHSARLWRFVKYDEYSPVFAKNALLDTLIAMYDRSAIMVGEDDQMISLSTYSEFHGRLDKCNPQHHMIGYRIKEDWYFDVKKQMGIFGIIAVCPVLYAKNETDSIDLGWFAYDAKLRGKMGTMFYVPPVQTGYPVGVEQTFFLRCFESEVYKYSNIGYKTIAEMFRTPDKISLEVQRMEVQPFEWEHDHWMDYFQKRKQ